MKGRQRILDEAAERRVVKAVVEGGLSTRQAAPRFRVSSTTIGKTMRRLGYRLQWIREPHMENGNGRA